MMTDEQHARRPEWTNGPLYKFMMDIFPSHRTICNYLDVLRLSRELNRSHEALYKWLRKGKLTPENAVLILNLATASPNAALLPSALTTRDFEQFIYATPTQ